MKRKILLIFLSIVTVCCLTFSISACSDDSETSSSGINSTEQSSSADDSTGSSSGDSNTEQDSSGDSNTEQDSSGDSGNEDTGSNDGSPAHVHNLAKTDRVEATCTTDGNTEYWYCAECGKYFSDAEATTEVSQSDTIITATDHTYSGYSHDENGHWQECTVCGEKTEPQAHTYDNNNICTVCGYEYIVASTGLEFTPSSNAYIVSGIGECTDTEIVIPSTYNSLPVTGIDANAFENQTQITSVYIPDSIQYIGRYSFDGCTSLSDVSIGKGVEYIYTYAFKNCTSLENITIPDNVTSIAESTFSGCSSLVSMTLPFVGGSKKSSSDQYQYPFGLIFDTTSYDNSVATKQYYIGSSTSTSTTYYIPASLTTVTITGGNILYGAFYGCTSLTSVTIGDNITLINRDAFYNCTALENITIGSGVITINEDAFYNTAYYNDSNNWTDNVLYIGTYLIKADKSSISGDYTIKDGTTAIAMYAFQGCTSLTSITIPDSVTSICYSAISGCTSLTSISIGSGVTYVDNYAFNYSLALTEIYFNATAMNDLSSGNWVFGSVGKNGDGITVTIGAKVTKIPDYLFCPYSSSSDYAPKITSVVFENGSVCTSIGDCAFFKCTSLTSVSIGDNVESIGSSAFSGCTSLVSVSIGNNVESIGNFAFSGCTSLETVTIPDNVTSIATLAFEGCTSLTSVIIGSNVTTIIAQAFSGCTSLTSVYYHGTADGWNNITIGSNTYLTNAAIYYYSESEPDYSDGNNYWYYNVNNEITLWKQS